MAGNLRLVLSYHRRVAVAAGLKTWGDLRLSAKRIFKGIAGALIAASLLAFFGYGTYSETRALFWFVSSITTAALFLGMFLWNLSLVPPLWDRKSDDTDKIRATVADLMELYAEGQKLQFENETATVHADLGEWAQRVGAWRNRVHSALPLEQAQFLMTCSPGIFDSVGKSQQTVILQEALNKLRLIIGRVEGWKPNDVD